jgi:hypothetical protein
VTRVDPKTQCVACRASIKRDAIICDVCGAPQKDLPPCPHCRGKGAVSPDAELRLVCNLCGGPRVPHLPGQLETSGGEVGLLVRADKLRKVRGAWRLGAIAGALTLPFIVLFALLLGLIWSWSVAFVIALLFGGPIAAGGAFAMRKNKDRTQEMATLLDQAWVSAATDYIEQKGGRVGAKDLAKALGIDRGRAEQLLAMVSVDSELASGEDKRRITVPADERFAELEAKAAEAEAAAAAEAEAEADAEAEVDAKSDQKAARH